MLDRSMGRWADGGVVVDKMLSSAGSQGFDAARDADVKVSGDGRPAINGGV